MNAGLIHTYRQYLPVTEKTRLISLNEGNTPLIHSPKISEKIGRGIQVYIKYEGLNPTGSFKDRGMTMAITKAVEKNCRAVICASTGNTSASAAAYSARAGIQCIVLLPAGKIAKGKLAQAFVYGAKVVEIDGNFDQALELVRELGTLDGFEIVNSINPYRIEGQKTASFEIIDTLGDAPAAHFIPVGNAGNITAYWKGYREYADLKKSTGLPHMCGFQAEGSAPLVHGKIIEHPETIATAIRIGNPASWEQAETAIQDSSGSIDALSDDDILSAQYWLSSNEGIFVEPASAASVSGLLKAIEKKGRAASILENLPDQSNIVCTVTGNGLKDIDAALKIADSSLIQAPANKDAILKKLAL